MATISVALEFHFNHRFAFLTMDQETKSIRLIITLGMAGFISGLILVCAYLYTLPLIEANRAAALEKAIYQVLPGCSSYKEMVLINGKLVPQATEGAEAIFAGYDKNEALIGFAIPAQEIGFQDVIAGIIGYDPVKKMVIGFEVLESKETPGLGDKIFKDAAFRDNFTALESESGIITVSKGEKSKPNEVEAITGATISSKAVVRLLNKGLAQWEKLISEYLATQTEKQDL